MRAVPDLFLTYEFQRLGVTAPLRHVLGVYTMVVTASERQELDLAATLLGGDRLPAQYGVAYMGAPDHITYEPYADPGNPPRTAIVEGRWGGPAAKKEKGLQPFARQVALGTGERRSF
ncbi:hypothetical protein [Streptosporangium sp. NPDC087985]|uniref:hypothetical protein n=1 Tax=Streptosporangium sp. NPDC087985 TaxID=3366196 RepID=UPI0038278A00